MNPNEVHEAQILLRAHGELRWAIAKNKGDFAINVHVNDDRQGNTTYIPFGRALTFVTIGMIEARLYELGVTPERGFEHDCFQCNGSGKEPMR